MILTQADTRCANLETLRSELSGPERKRRSTGTNLLNWVGATVLPVVALITFGNTTASADPATFNEDFAVFTSSPDGSKGWMTCYPYGGEAARTLTNNHEAEYYSDSSVGVNPFSIDSGILTITANPAKPGSNPYGLPYTSGVITTFKSFSQLYGLFEIRAKLPAGQGLWPAFWLLPSSNIYTAELDAFEVLGSNPTQLFATTHGMYGAKWGTDSQMVQVPSTSDGFHIYGVNWEPDNVVFLMDHHEIARAPTPTSMNTPMYMIINLAVGGHGSWPGPPNQSTHFPAQMQVDWVRAYASINTQYVAGTRAIRPH